MGGKGETTSAVGRRTLTRWLSSQRGEIPRSDDNIALGTSERVNALIVGRFARARERVAKLVRVPLSFLSFGFRAGSIVRGAIIIPQACRSTFSEPASKVMSSRAVIRDELGRL